MIRCAGIATVLVACLSKPPRPAETPGDGGDDAGTDAPTDAPFVCQTTSMACPGDQPMRLLACGEPTDCWIGCRDGTVISPDEASAFCAAWGGRLGRINSAAEESCVRATLDGAIILGLTQAADQATPDVGWSGNGDGVTPSFLPWSPGQPDDLDGNEDGQAQCAFSNASADWDDTPCNLPASARFTCRYP